VSRRTALLAIAVGVFVSGAAGALIGYAVTGSSSSPKQSSRTKVTIFATPVARAPTAFPQFDGACNLGSSEVTTRPDAARCFAGDAVLDPCFHSQAGSRPGILDLFVCPGDPWGNERVQRSVVTVHGGAGTLGQAPSSLRPWALLLANGQHCLAISGGSGTTAGLRYNYQCFAAPFGRSTSQPIGKAAGVVLGDPDQHKRTWAVLFEEPTGKAGFTPMDVRAAYE
jgi:hypothetical protein